MSKNTSLGMEENIESALSYVLGPLTGIVLLVLEKENKNVRFHAMQSTIFIGGLLILNFVLSLFRWIPLLGWLFGLINWALGIVIIVAIVYLAYMAYQGKIFKIPYIGETIWHNINK